MFVYNLFESTKDTVVLTYGRMNPPTIGHQKLVDAVLAIPGDHVIMVSHTQDNKKNPLTAQEKVACLKKMYPGKNVFFPASPENPTLITAASNLSAKGYKNLIVVVGADRVAQFETLLNQYNGVFNDEGKGYKFKNIKVVSAGDRDPDADSVEGMSASKMREFAIAGNVNSFALGLPTALKSMATDLVAKIKERLAPKVKVKKTAMKKKVKEHGDKWERDQYGNEIGNGFKDDSAEKRKYANPEKEINDLVKQTSPVMRKKLRLPEPKEIKESAEFEEALQQGPDQEYWNKQRKAHEFWSAMKKNQDAEKNVFDKGSIFKPQQKIEEPMEGQTVDEAPHLNSYTKGINTFREKVKQAGFAFSRGDLRGLKSNLFSARDSLLGMRDDDIPKLGQYFTEYQNLRRAYAKQANIGEGQVDESLNEEEYDDEGFGKETGLDAHGYKRPHIIGRPEGKKVPPATGKGRPGAPHQFAQDIGGSSSNYRTEDAGQDNDLLNSDPKIRALASRRAKLQHELMTLTSTNESTLTTKHISVEKPFKPSMDVPKGEYDPIHGKAPKKGTLKYRIWKQKVTQDKQGTIKEMHEHARQGNLLQVTACLRKLQSVQHLIKEDISKALRVAKRNAV